MTQADTLLIPVPVLGELFYGALNSAHTDRNYREITKFTEYADIIPLDDIIAKRYAVVRSHLKARGRPIPENDIWIAASWLEFDVPLMTRDRLFSIIEDL